MGPQDSATSQSILDAAERVLRSKGYCAISSQTVAEEAGVKRQLIFYYFQNVDEMILAAFRRRMSRIIEKLEQNSRLDRPLHAVWEDYQHAFDARLIFEYMALVNRHEIMRDAIKSFVEQSRSLQQEIIAKAFKKKNIDPGMIPPDAVAFLISAITMSLTREEETGITASHSSIRQIVEKFLAWCE
jgi:AcrR family transcriptional regulator